MADVVQHMTGDLIRLLAEDYNIILGVDWMSWRYAQVDCKQKAVRFVNRERYFGN
jgi:hypothetical protein